MKKLFLLLALSSVVAAEPTGFSPTMPFGIPASAHRTVEPANNASQAPYNYNGGFGYYYYWGGGGSGMATPGSNGSTYGETLPTYDQKPSKSLDSYNQPSRRKSDTLPGY
jgi:hypothetical protein